MDTRLRLPHEARHTTGRLRAFRALLTAAFLGLLTRLWYLQVVKGKEYDVKAQGVRVRNVYMPAPRGIIYDRNGRILVTSRSSYTVSLVPAYLASRKSETIHYLAHLLNMQSGEMEAILARDSYRSFDPVKIRQGVDVGVVTRIEENRVRLPGVQVESDVTRFYPYGPYAAHALGYIGEISRPELDRVDRRKWRAGDIFGKFGIECTYNEYLHGVKGAEQIEVDAAGRPTLRLGERERIPGDSLMLALDADAQTAAETGLNRYGRGGAVVALDVRNGEVLVMASKPDFDPNVFSRKISPRIWAQLLNDRRRPLINRVISSKYPPGSTYKMITAAAALEAGVVNPDFSVYCDGTYKLGRVFRCWKRNGHGVVNLHSALSKSCDIYFYTLGRKLGHQRLAEMSRAFGLGAPADVDLSGEARGTVPTKSWKRKNFRERWYPGDTINMAIGQGFLEVTPMQMCRVTAAVANGGVLVHPHILKKVMSPTGETLKGVLPTNRTGTTSEERVPVSSQNLLEIRRGMRLAVLDGTAGVLNMPGLAVAAKTGSAEDIHSPVPHAWIVSFAPYVNPQVAVVVFLENAGHGGTEAAPIAKRVYESLFHLNQPSAKGTVVVARQPDH